MSVKMIGKLSWMMTLFIALMACTGLVMLKGWGTSIEWYPRVEQKPLPVEQVAPVDTVPTPLQTYSEIWEKSLFNRDRVADTIAPVLKADTGVPPLTGLALTGLVISPPLYKAFFKTAEGSRLILNEGEALPNGWIVDKIQSERVFLSFKSARQELTLPVLKVPAEALR